jgi:hypothetical protein
VAGVDSRFRFVVPVYGCGYLAEDSAVSGWFKNEAGPRRAKKWTENWGPARYLPHATMPMLWVTDVDDSFFHLPSWQKSALLPPGPRTLSIHLNMTHGQDQGATPEEIAAFADSILREGKPLAMIQGVQRLKNHRVGVRFNSVVPIIKVNLNYTNDTGPWQGRHWKSVAATRNGSNEAQAELPQGSQAFFFNLIDDRGLVVSSIYQTTTK